MRTRKLSRLVWIGSVFTIVAAMMAIVGSWLLHEKTTELLTENLRNTLLSVSITQSANIDADAINALRNEEDWQKPEWTEVVSKLKRAKDSNENIVFMYIFRKTLEDPTQMEFVADAESINPYVNWDSDPTNDVDANQDGIIEPDGPDKLQWPGQPYPEAVDIPEAYEAYEGPLTARELYEDSYGQVLTGYAPIKDDKGNTVAVLATDIKADDFFTVTRQTLFPFLIFIAFLVAIILVLAFILIYMWDKHAAALEVLSNKLAAANKQLKELDRQKSEFVSIASHQLRSPLTAIKGYASMILEGSFGKVPLGAQEAVGRIFRSSMLMARSVEDFLNVSRIESGGMRYELVPFDMCDIIQTVVDEQRIVAQEKNLKFVFTRKDNVKTCSMVGDMGKLKQVLTNLIDNAIKYTPKGTITVVFEKDSKKKRALISITDTGVGMSPKTKRELFRKYSRARNASRVNVSGTGLGLYVAKQLVEAHGGTISADSRGEGKGSTFYIELPLEQPEKKTR